LHRETKTHKELITELSSIVDSLAENHQYWIGLAGAPGSGKSTVAQKVKAALDDKLVVIPMDGYHYYRAELDAMANPQEAHQRRGAPFTFNADKLVGDLLQARKTGSGVFPSVALCSTRRV